MKIVAISGSLRAKSSNAAVLRAAAARAPAGMQVVIFEGIGALPHFNPDLDAEGAEPPPAVKEFRALLASADGFVISSPEYAFGVPGALKDALDWIVSSGELRGKPIVLINASPTGGDHAREALIRTLTVMEGRLLPEASLQTPFVRKMLGPDGDVADPTFLRRIEGSMIALGAAVSAGDPGDPSP